MPVDFLDEVVAGAKRGAGADLIAHIGEQWNASVFYNVNFGAQTYLENAISASLNFAF